MRGCETTAQRRAHSDTPREPDDAGGQVGVTRENLLASTAHEWTATGSVMRGGTTYHFVTDGIESALDQAREAAGGKDIMLWGGAQVVNQYLAAGLLNEVELHVVPILLGDGARLFDNLGTAGVQLEQLRAVEAPGVTHLKYRVMT